MIICHSFDGTMNSDGDSGDYTCKHCNTQTNTRRRIMVRVCSTLLCQDPGMPEFNQGNRFLPWPEVLRTRYGGLTQITYFLLFVCWSVCCEFFLRSSKSSEASMGESKDNTFLLYSCLFPPWGDSIISKVLLDGWEETAQLERNVCWLGWEIEGL